MKNSKSVLRQLKNELKSVKNISEDQVKGIVSIDNKKIGIDIYKALEVALKMPGVKVDRAKFLRKELSPYFSKKVINVSIENNPASAGISTKKIDKIANSVIAYQRNFVSALSFASSIPGGYLLLPAVVMDLVQFFYHTLIIIQKLAYLYGFDQFEIDEQNIDSKTMNQLLIFMGAMYGVNGATTILTSVSKSASNQLTKTLAKLSLTKGAIYPLIKKIAKTIGIKMTKQVFANAIGSVVPIVGAAISGTIAFSSFNANCKALKKVLRENKIADPKFYKAKD